MSVNGLCLEWSVGNHHEPVSEILGHAAVVCGRVAYDHIPVTYDFGIAAAVGIDHEVGHLLFRVGESERRRPFGRGEFGNHIVFSEIDLIVVRLHGLRLVREPALPSLLVINRTCGHRHNRE